MSDRIAVLAQHLLPKQALTQLAGRLAASNAGSLTTAVIRWFIGRYDVDMSEAAEPNPVCYPTFNEFFTRALRDGARPLAEADFVCPVDGAISQFGRIERDQIFQAKGHRYSTAALLGGDSERAAAFVDGDFATLYLSPRDYHRIHMPVGGRLRQMLHVPGELFSVNPATARGVAGLFARNERVVCLFDADFGPFVLTLVGATIVGSMATVWHGTVNPPRSGEIRSWTYDDRRIELAKGEEMGRFMLGSTVVMLFPRNTLAFNPDWRAARPVRMGEMMAKRTPSGA
ncbi:MAG TPA: archaetidylserine decarboxylase [Accumulibacter sp.]|uniref:archaetidylserine decarboxylase n=1 Tax=Accumulibacter sp. TaxID=2053492 RepID=UPI002618DBF1|nr:archaetidylserine decarboxylase [Accumulibacter sp.]HMX68520.1 archaetidylserine decarboxylase [Accumulibacter sp.]HNG16462.1 archaetidylserine decarboxylase [Accumulibacter sp.]HNG87730.1 archaetidylserine decarboxylase [Accumulibacter sp.]HNK03403.1 archaetidylserine decarboxylase [Accumulibacter sp.]HNL98055.1 archaetidylserine decarboxylase [Accumulibacter sp.]